jgi:hypothetical protein
MKRKRDPEPGSPEVDQQCVVKGCGLRGFPSDGFDYYICDGCLDELADLITAEWSRRVGRHAV